jgi:hypothetical protein
MRTTTRYSRGRETSSAKALQRALAVAFFACWLIAPLSARAQTVVGTINVGIPGLTVQVTDQLDNNLTDLITIQATNNTSATYYCTGHVGFFQLATGSGSAFPVDGTATIPPGGPYVVVSAQNPVGSGVGNTLAYDAASCQAAPSSGTGGGGNGGNGPVVLQGTFGYNIDFNTNTARLTASEVLNSSNAGTGTLRLELWALAAPYSGSGSVTGTQMAVAQLPDTCGVNGTLAAGKGCAGISLPSTFKSPPPGTYYVTMFLTEDVVSCGGFCSVDYGNFDKTVTINSSGAPGNNGGIELIGTSTYSLSLANNTAQLTVPEVLNTTSGTTGTLRLELWLTTAPYANGTSVPGNRIAMSYLPSPCPSALAAGGSCSNIGSTLSVTNLPTPGTYYASLFVTQYDTSANCPAADHYCIATGLNFSGMATVPAATPAPPPSNNSGGGSTTSGGGGGEFDGFSVACLLVFAAYRGWSRLQRRAS